MGTRLWHIAVFVVIVLAVAAIMHPTNFRMAWMYLDSGHLREAVAKLTKIYEKDPSDYRTIRMLAMALEEQGQVDRAEKLYVELVQIKPRDDNFKELVRFFTWTLQPRKAQGAYEQWLDFKLRNRISLDNEEGIQMLTDLYAYDLLYEDYRKAIDVLYLLRGVQPGEREWIDGDLITLYEMIGDLNATVAFIEEVLKRNDRNVYALEKLMQLAKVTGKIGLTEGYLAKNIEESPSDPKAWERMIAFQAGIGDLAAADSWYVRRLKRSPDDWAMKKNYVNWLLATEQQKRAIAYLEELDPERQPDPWYMETLVNLYEWNGEKKKLVPIYQARFDQNPGDRKNAQELVWLLDGLKEYAQEESVLKRLVALSPDNAEYETMLMNFYDARNDSAAALSLLEKLARTSKDPKYLKRLGEYYLWNAEKSGEQ